ncbi:hypothetical protein ACJJIL_16110 [Microbulbifer sp. EKSA005]|uniref:hypothetical protein n=1 Tax=Microbulbifer sp. EKSA005 TaxID=3243364 RepID=UPI00404215E1
MNKIDQPVIIQKEKLASEGNGKRLTKEEAIKSAKDAEKKVLQSKESNKPAVFIEME